MDTSTPPGIEGEITYGGWVIAYRADMDEDDGFYWSFLNLKCDGPNGMPSGDFASFMDDHHDDIDALVKATFLADVKAHNDNMLINNWEHRRHG